MRELANKLPLRLCLIYILAGGMWILLSDQVITSLLHDTRWLVLLEACKDLTFVVLSASLLFWYVRHQLKRQEQTTTELTRVNAELRQQRDLLDSFINSLPGVAYVVDPQRRLLRWNRRFEEVTGRSHAELEQIDSRQLFAAADSPVLQAGMARALTEGAATVEVSFLDRAGRATPYLFTGVRAVLDGVPCMVGVGMDITARKQSDALLDGQKRVLEMIARGAALPETLDALLRLIEGRAGDLLCSVLLLDADGVHLRAGAAPSLPESFRRTADGLAIGPRSGSCGTAVFRREPVIVEDIATDPLWEGGREAAAAHGLRACWSTPIFDAQQRVLGSFACYHRTPARPSERELRLIEIATHTAAIAISRQREVEALRNSEERYRLIVETAEEGIWMIDADNRTSFVNPKMALLLGCTVPQMLGRSMFEFMDDEGRAIAGANVERRQQGIREQHEFKFRRADGTALWAWLATNPIHDPAGRYVGALAMVSDVTERKRVEAERGVARHRVDLLAGLVHRLAEAPTGKDAARLILQTADDLLGWDACWLYLWHAQVGKFENVASFDCVEGERREVPPNAETLTHPSPMAKRVMTEGAQLVLRQNEIEQPVPLRPYGNQRRSLSLMFAPVQHGGELIGIISIQSYRTQAYDPAALELLRGLADHCASALHRIRTEESLRASESRLAAAQARARLGNWEVEFATQNRVWSAEMFRLLGRDPSRGPAPLDEFLSAVHPDDVERFRRNRAQAIAERGPHHDEFRILWPDGRVRWVETHGESILDAAGTLVRQVGTLQDITARKQTEAALREAGERLHQLSQRLIEIQESERRQLARELHDEIGQALTATKLNLEGLLREPEPAARSKRVADSVALVERLLQTVRNLSLNLRPPMLDDLGLAAALRWLLDQHARTTGQQVNFNHDLGDERFAAMTETACFRVAQEALTNVNRHARAHRVRVELRRESGSLTLMVRDDGVGFNVAEARRRATQGGSLGLVGMQERVLLAGGQLEVTSADGGTKLTAWFPCHGQNQLKTMESHEADSRIAGR
jgi:PAS domain S-box-containing protein